MPRLRQLKIYMFWIFLMCTVWTLYQSLQLLKEFQTEFQINQNPVTNVSGIKSVFRSNLKIALNAIASSKFETRDISIAHAIDVVEVSLNRSEIIRLKSVMKYLNDLQMVYNLDRYGPLTSEDTVIVIQVHNRLENLKYLVDSLTNVKHINKSLVIFSHDYWDEEINHFVRSISAFKVMQIFFPFSIQLNPFSFPGRDPRDCSWNGTYLKNVTTCVNSNWSDSFGHFREASLTQIKHHWWWKLVQIFDKIRELQEFRGYVLFLEEDHYVFPDILHVLKLLVEESSKLENPVNVFCLGNYLGELSKHSHLAYLRKWSVINYNMGFAFNREVYRQIKERDQDFCSHDDYNWDWTLNFVVSKCFPEKPRSIAVKFSRVLHIGSCGTHVRKEECNLEKAAARAVRKLKSNSRRLFPAKMQVLKYSRFSSKAQMVNGGWRDLRDHSLCLAISSGTHDSQTVLSNLQYENYI